jgi:hypothetical protein
VLARVVEAVGAVFWGFLFYGLIDLLTPFVEGQEFAAHYLTETGWGLTYLVLVAVPLLVLVVRPGSTVALAELAVVGLSLAVGAILAGSPAHLLPALGVLATAGLVAALGRPLTPLGGARPVPVTTLLSGVALLPAAAYAWDMARATENPEETWGLDHYPTQAGFALAVVLVALLASYAAGGSRRSAWLPALTAALCATWMGTLSLVWPERLGSLGTWWGVVAVVWGIAIAALATVGARTVTPPARARPAGPPGSPGRE